LLPNYNILTEAGSSFGYKHTDLDRKKMSENFSLERKLQIGSLNKGKSLSEEVKEEMRDKALLRTPIMFSEKAMLNMKKSSISVLVLNKDDTVYGQYPSILEASKALRCNEKTVRRALIAKKAFLRNKFKVYKVK
jgi:group I intron endonuclease